MAAVVFERVSKVFDDGTEALVDFDLEVADGELVVLVGPSGCGKSTVLRLLAGLETATSGEIRIGGRPVHDLAPRARDVAMVFQNYALYPHMSVRQNLAFPLRMMKRPRGEIEERVRLTASMLGLEALLDRKPAALSGGQRQRVAMGRALVREPDVFLMDEPLSNLDAKLRVQMRAEITTLQRRLRTTTLYVTHDQVEAMTVGHRLAVLRDGRLQQVGPPQALYDRPANLFVATFIGSPSMNLFASSIEAAGGRPRLRVGSSWLPLPANGFPLEPRGVIVGLRPEAFVPADSVPAELRIEVDVRTVEVVGHEQLVHFDAGAEPAPAEVLAAGGFARARSLPGGADAIDAPAVAWVARLAPDVALAAGTRQQLGVDVRRLYLFGHDGKRLAP